MKLSVALCTYNGERFLRAQLDSILNQTTPVDEIVVCDDVSTDTTRQILEEYREKYSAIFQIVYNEQNLRSNKNFEKAITLTTGDYIFLSDQDDIWVSDKVEKIMAAFQNNPTAEGIFTNADFIDENSNTINSNLDLWTNVNFFPFLDEKKTDLFESLVYMGNFLTGATLCIKKEVKEFAIPFQTLPHFLHDEWLAFLLTQRQSLFYLDEYLIHYRLHSNQQIGVGKINSDSSIIDEKRAYAKLVLGMEEPKSYKLAKNCLVRNLRQYTKYGELNSMYSNEHYTAVRTLLKARHQVLETEMKKLNPILFFFRKSKLKIT